MARWRAPKVRAPEVGSLSAMAALIWLTQSSVAFVLDTPTVRYKVSEEQGCAAGTQH